VSSSRSNAAKKNANSSARDVDKTLLSAVSLEGVRNDEWQRSAMECDRVTRPRSLSCRCTLLLVFVFSIDF